VLTCPWEAKVKGVAVEVFSFFFFNTLFGGGGTTSESSGRAGASFTNSSAHVVTIFSKLTLGFFRAGGASLLLHLPNKFECISKMDEAIRRFDGVK
jgi:hypothetical protein